MSKSAPGRRDRVRHSGQGCRARSQATGPLCRHVDGREPIFGSGLVSADALRDQSTAAKTPREGPRAEIPVATKPNASEESTVANKSAARSVFRGGPCGCRPGRCQGQDHDHQKTDACESRHDHHLRVTWLLYTAAIPTGGNSLGRHSPPRFNPPLRYKRRPTANEASTVKSQAPLTGVTGAVLRRQDGA